MGGQFEHDRREVEYTADAGIHQGVCDVLGGFDGHGDYAQFGAVAGDNFSHTVQGVDFQAVHGLADFGGVRIEEGHEAEALLLEAAVAQQGAGKIADTDDEGRSMPRRWRRAAMSSWAG